MANLGLDALWAAHVQMPFPSAARGTEVHGIDLVLLDSLASGCISSLIHAGGKRDVARLTLLKDLAPQVESVVPRLTGEPRAYFSHLEKVVAAALRDVSSGDGK